MGGVGAGVGSLGVSGSALGVGLGSSFGAGEGEGEGAAAGVAALEAAARMGVLFTDVACVSRSTTLGRAVLPESHSAAVRAGSIELAGGKMLKD